MKKHVPSTLWYCLKTLNDNKHKDIGSFPGRKFGTSDGRRNEAKSNVKADLQRRIAFLRISRRVTGYMQLIILHSPLTSVSFLALWGKHEGNFSTLLKQVIMVSPVDHPQSA